MSSATSSGGFSFRGHIRVLCSIHGIELCEDETADGIARMSTDGATLMSQRIEVPPITTLSRYFIALHEVGHRALRHRKGQKTIIKEREAWNWAAQHAKVPPDVAVIKEINSCLRSYGDIKVWFPPLQATQASRLP